MKYRIKDIQIVFNKPSNRFSVQIMGTEDGLGNGSDLGEAIDNAISNLGDAIKRDVERFWEFGDK